MLNYHPAGDVYHCIFRLLLLLNELRRRNSETEWDRLRLIDFYFLFPHLIQTISLPNSYRQYRAIFNSIPPQYEELSSPRRLYFQVSAIQESAIRSIIAKGYCDRDLFLAKGIIHYANSPPQEISELFNSDKRSKATWFTPFLEVFLNVPLSGASGLKARSGIAEYRYDAI